MNRKNLILVTSLLLAAVFSRFVPHIGNFTAVIAVSLLGGAWIKRTQLAIIIPLAAVLLSDLVINNTLYASGSGFTLFYPGMGFVYGAYAVIALIGRFGLSKMNNNKYAAYLGFGLASSIFFFLTTNFGSWLADPMYTKDFAGLMTAYEMGIPFFRGTVVGTLAYGMALIAVRDAILARVSSAQTA